MDYTVNPPGSDRTIGTLPFTALGGQPGFDIEDMEKFLAEPNIATLAYSRSDGRPNQSPMWYTYRDGEVTMTTVTGSPKHNALGRDPRVCFAVQDDRPPYRAVIIDGTIECSPLDPGDDPTEGMAVRYFGRLGAAEYDKLTDETYSSKGLTLLRLKPQAVKGFDNTHALNPFTLGFVRVRDRLPIPRRWL